MIDTSGTRYTIQPWSKDIWIFGKWQNFFSPEKFQAFCIIRRQGFSLAFF